MTLKFSKKAISLFLTMIMILSPLMTIKVSAAETTYSYTFTRVHSGDQQTGLFSISSKGLKGICCQKGTGAKNGKATLTKLSNTGDYAKVLYYYGYYKGWRDGSKDKAILLSKMLTHMRDSSRYNTEKIKNYIATAKKVTVPTGFYAYKANPTNGSQEFMCWKMVKGTIQVKKTSTAKVPSNYNFKDIQYTVYKSDKTTKVGTLTLDASGVSNKLSVPAGATYYIKETKSNDFFKLNSTWYNTTVNFNVATQVNGDNKIINTKDEPNLGSITIRKALSDDSDNGGTLDNFEFSIWQNGKFMGKAITGEDGVVSFTNLHYGTYTIKETIPERKTNVERYHRVTYDHDVTISGAEPELTVRWENRYTEFAGLTILKTVDDSDSKYATPLNEFSFEVLGVHDNAKTLTKQRAIELANIQTAAAVGDWDVTGLDELNNAAKNTETTRSTPGTYALKFTNTLADGTPVEISVNVNLVYVGSDVTSAAQTINLAGNAFTYNNFDFAGAATTSDKTYPMNTTGSLNFIDIPPGWYTVTEKMTDAQKLHYTVDNETIGPVYISDDAVQTFSFENKAPRTEIVIDKTSADDDIANKTFKLTGTTAWGADVELTGTTDEDGHLSFGRIHKGTYTVTEESFNETEYRNVYPMDGKDKPSISFTVTGDDEVLYIGGAYKQGCASPEKQTFKNIPIPSIQTVATDYNTKRHMSNAMDEEGVTIVDTVTYERLVASEEYTLQGKLVDKETGEVLKDDLGNEIKAEKVFVPEESSGTEKVCLLAGYSLNMLRVRAGLKPYIILNEMRDNTFTGKITAQFLEIDPNNPSVSWQKTETVSYTNHRFGSQAWAESMYMSGTCGDLGDLDHPQIKEKPMGNLSGDAMQKMMTQTGNGLEKYQYMGCISKTGYGIGALIGYSKYAHTAYLLGAPNTHWKDNIAIAFGQYNGCNCMFSFREAK